MEDVEMDLRFVLWAAVIVTLVSGTASIVLSARRRGSPVSYRLADRLAQIAVVGASVILATAGS